MIRAASQGLLYRKPEEHSITSLQDFLSIKHPNGLLKFEHWAKNLPLKQVLSSPSFSVAPTPKVAMGLLRGTEYLVQYPNA